MQTTLSYGCFPYSLTLKIEAAVSPKRCETSTRLYGNCFRGQHFPHSVLLSIYTASVAVDAGELLQNRRMPQFFLLISLANCNFLVEILFLLEKF
jgi:hypothetical protein